MTRGNYVVFDGMDGSGKGTQLKLLKEVFDGRVVFTYEPGGTPFADKIRELVRNDPLARESTPLNNLLLFFAARDDLMHHVVMPALMSGTSVFSGRGYSSTFAFQICGEEQESLESLFYFLRTLMFDRVGRYRPDVHIVYDLPAEVARERAMADAKRDRNHFDERPLEYYQRVRRGFRTFGSEREQVIFVDAMQTPEAIHQETLEHLKRLGIE